jgi:hypothetical protein
MLSVRIWMPKAMVIINSANPSTIYLSLPCRVKAQDLRPGVLLVLLLAQVEQVYVYAIWYDTIDIAVCT